MSNEIKISQESTEWLRLQAMGTCSTKCKKRLTKLNLASNTKELFKNLYTYLNDLYFGLHQTLSVELSIIENVLIDMRSKISQCEQDLVDYIWMVVHGVRDNVVILKLESHYNETIKNR